MPQFLALWCTQKGLCIAMMHIMCLRAVRDSDWGRAKSLTIEAPTARNNCFAIQRYDLKKVSTFLLCENWKVRPVNQFAQREKFLLRGFVFICLHLPLTSVSDHLDGSSKSYLTSSKMTWQLLFVMWRTCECVCVCVACCFAVFIITGWKGRRRESGHTVEEYPAIILLLL